MNLGFEGVFGAMSADNLESLFVEQLVSPWSAPGGLVRLTIAILPASI